MAFGDLYRKQAALLIKMLPHIAREDCFALKGGTAINLFIRNVLPSIPLRWSCLLITIQMIKYAAGFWR